MKQILTILGARPQFIKAATISRIIKQKYSSSLNEIIVHTGQHYDSNMSDIFFKEMQIPNPHYHLEIKKGASHAAIPALVFFRKVRTVPIDKKMQKNEFTRMARPIQGIIFLFSSIKDANTTIRVTF